MLVALGATLVLPLVPRLPLQLPLAVQLVALLLVQLRVVLSPSSISVRAAVRLTVGAGVAVTRTLTLSEALPPGPEHVRIKVLSSFSTPVEAEPEIARSPLQAPLALQLVASVLVQSSWVADPCSTLVDAAVRTTPGRGAGSMTVIETLSVSDPPGPVQVRA